MQSLSTNILVCFRSTMLRGRVRSPLTRMARPCGACLARRHPSNLCPANQCYLMIIAATIAYAFGWLPFGGASNHESAETSLSLNLGIFTWSPLPRSSSVITEYPSAHGFSGIYLGICWDPVVGGYR